MVQSFWSLTDDVSLSICDITKPETQCRNFRRDLDTWHDHTKVVRCNDESTSFDLLSDAIFATLRVDSA